MNAKPDKKAILAEIAKLKEQRPYLPPSAFGDDNAGACSVQIEVLEFNLPEDQIYDKWPGDEEDAGDGTQHKLDAALEARRWLDGDTQEPPGVGWEPIVKRAKGLFKK